MGSKHERETKCVLQMLKRNRLSHSSICGWCLICVFEITPERTVALTKMSIYFFFLSPSVLLHLTFFFTGLCSLWVLLFVCPWAVQFAEVSNALICCGGLSGGAYNSFLLESSSSILTTAKDPVSRKTFSLFVFIKLSKQCSSIPAEINKFYILYCFIN